MAWGDALPRNFSWLRVNVIAGCSLPSSELELKSLVGVNIRHVITLSPESLPPACIRAMASLSWTVIGVENFKGADPSQFDSFFHTCQIALERRESIVLHCRSGRGRTGMFLAAYLIKFEGMDADTAIQTVRSVRPNSIETRDQELSLQRLKIV